MVVLIASHNRRNLTVRALQQLEGQTPVGIRLSAVLVDCGSTDGTAAACEDLGDWVQVVRAPSNYFWAEAMSMAERVAQEKSPDLLLWANDDVAFDPDALPRLLQCYDDAASGNDDVVAIGSMRDLAGGVSYGGILFRKRISRWEHVIPGSTASHAQAANGNFLLCSSAFADRVGGIDGAFGHSFADFDWTIRASKTGAVVIVAPGYYGVCNRNSLRGTYRDPGLSAKEQWKHICSKKGLPLVPNARFLFRHGGPAWPVIWAKPYAKILLRLASGK
nr:glycosyltransferase family 2 protein [Pseudarthrobacter sp. fls2-241-R2A-127]